MSRSLARHPLRRFAATLVAVALLPLQALAVPQSLSILHVGDQESWLLSAQGNLRDDAT
jgi:5'-nucleotidase